MKTRLCGAALSTTALLMAAAPAYAFPTRTDVGDSFSRSGTASLGANWSASAIPGATGTVALGSQRLQFPATAWSSAHWSAAQFGGLQEAQVQKTSPGQVGVTACLTNPGPTASGYALTTEGTGALTLKRYTNGVATTLFSNDSSGGVVATGNAVGIAITSTGVQAWIGNGTWTLAKTVADSAAASCSGSIGVIGLGASGDNFGGGGLAFGTGGGLPSIAAQAAGKFTSSIGVNTHFRYTTAPYCSNAGATTAISRMQELGIDDIRDEVTSWASSDTCGLRARYTQLVSAGFGINLLGHTLNASGQSVSAAMLRFNNPATATDDVLDIAQLVNNAPKPPGQPGAGLTSVEAPNEFDGKEPTVLTNPFAPASYGSYSYPWRQKISQLMPQFRTASHARAGLANTDVVFASLARGGPRNYDPTNSYKAYAQGIGAAANGTFDRNNMHFYSSTVAPETTIDGWVADARAISSTTPLDSTEFGYNDGTDVVSVSRRAAAIYTARGLLALAARGVSRTYLYELADVSPGSTVQDRWGLLDNGLNRKPSFYAVKRLLGALADGDADGSTAFTPAALGLQITAGSPIQSHLVGKQDGSYVLALWRPDSVYDKATSADLTPASVSTALTFGASFTASTFRPAEPDPTTTIKTGAVAWTPAGTGSSLTVPVGGDPVLVKLVPTP